MHFFGGEPGGLLSCILYDGERSIVSLFIKYPISNFDKFRLFLHPRLLYLVVQLYRIINRTLILSCYFLYRCSIVTLLEAGSGHDRYPLEVSDPLITAM